MIQVKNLPTYKGRNLFCQNSYEKHLYILLESVRVTGLIN